MSKGRLPLRKCVGCAQMKPKPELVRVVRTPESDCYIVDSTGKQPGRGAYVCATPECIAKAQKQKGFERSYKCGSPREIYSQLAGTSEGAGSNDT
ncbi:MAG: YlxR family protein [Defluviitaleaceae bacterium]|nr:YlxR family protein [Defluviitaleaceae bacterium]